MTDYNNKHNRYYLDSAYEMGEDARRLAYLLGCSGQNAIILSRERLV